MIIVDGLNLFCLQLMITILLFLFQVAVRSDSPVITQRTDVDFHKDVSQRNEQTGFRYLQQEKGKVYGVRWMMSNHFSALKSYKNNEYYLLMFNSNELLPGNVILYLQNSPTTCSYKIFTFLNNSTFIYQCRINHQLQHNSIQYVIVSQVLITNGKQQNTTIKLNRSILFQEQFFPLSYSSTSNFIFIGNFNFENADQLAALNSQITAKNVGLVLFTGQFNPPLSQYNYESALSAFENFGSRIPSILMNGNPDNNISKLLFTYTFYAPLWQQYQSYFSLIDIPFRNITILGFNPLFNLQSKEQDRINLTSILSAQFTKQESAYLLKHQFVIGLSPLSYKCSESVSCEKSAAIMSQYTSYFKQIGLDLYLSCSENGFERTKGLCWQDAIEQGNSSNFNFNCPIYVNEGNKPNDTLAISANNRSDFYSSNVGFGVIVLQGLQFELPKKVTYNHISFSTKQIEDSFSMSQIQIAVPKQEANVMGINIRWIIVGFEYVILIGLIIFISYTIIKLRWKERTIQVRAEGHVQMVEEGVPQQNNIRDPIIS